MCPFRTSKKAEAKIELDMWDIYWGKCLGSIKWEGVRQEESSNCQAVLTPVKGEREEELGRKSLRLQRGQRKISPKPTELGPWANLTVRIVPHGKGWPIAVPPPSSVLTGAAWKQPGLEEILGESKGAKTTGGYPSPMLAEQVILKGELSWYDDTRQCFSPSSLAFLSSP